MYKITTWKSTTSISKETRHGNSELRKITENRFLIILLSAYLAIFTPGLNNISLAAELTNQQEGYNVIENLVVNNRNKFKTVIFESEAEGISEMRKLIANSQIEESWVYLPHLKKWIEIGHNEEVEKKMDNRYITKAKLDVQLLDELMSENNNMALYHFHPSRSLSLEDKIRKREESGSPMNDKDIESEKIKLLIKSAYPSRSDLLNMIGNSMEFFERNTEGNITFKVCSHYGITEYHLTDEGMAHLSADYSFKQILWIKGVSLSANIEVNVKGEILEMNPMETRSPLKRIKMSPKLKRKPVSRYVIIDPLTRIQKAIESMNSEHIRVTFTPYQ
ncbi:MAG: hypothetical protein K8F52_00510 [Candidatus Scalindua rubra]|uniref:Uncharacterized protein n=1 Tax=Candidatus Scalindua brodae TaxID=237368 RepID=A0A0B0EGI9_9BACT|nr:MAG: hypothetical protein SCABRO_03032 [Candidatus Scalindua brodae]MBZ0107121.1 hypothetical protein [Candidatus Scalindua rubra]TWU38111.1 hypothetical protein S225a_01580 [Candidatus Brocadiaceae bacterium S225]